MIPFIFKNLRTNFTYYLPSKEYSYGILLMDSDEVEGGNPRLVVMNTDDDYGTTIKASLFSNKKEALARLEEMRNNFPQCTYKLIRYTLLSN